MIIIITGTPGTGKTVLAKRIAAAFGYQHIEVNSLIKKNKLAEYYDKKRHCHVVDEKKLMEVLHQFIEEKHQKALKQHRELKLVIDSHMAHVIDPEYVDLCIVTRCGLSTLYTRLKKRGYPQQKISDNIESEIMEVCLTEAQDNGHDPILIDTSKPVLLPFIKKHLYGIHPKLPMAERAKKKQRKKQRKIKKK